jgi:Protein of unknown function (DUF4239)
VCVQGDGRFNAGVVLCDCHKHGPKKKLKLFSSIFFSIYVYKKTELAEMLHGVDGAAVSRQSSVATCESLLVSLNAHRSNRVATTLSVFPKIHWAVIIVLYLGIIAAFLIDSNQEVLQYLNSIELRILFAIMIGGGSGAAMLVKDLQDPFEGSFCITREARQLESFLQVLQADMSDTMRQTQQVPGQVALIALDREKRRGQYYDTKNTLYFHLLTGPVAGQVKLLGDLFAWAIGKVSQQYQFVKKKFLLLRSSFVPYAKRWTAAAFSPTGTRATRTRRRRRNDANKTRI